MNKICTSKEQSRKIMELGIDRKTSDMFYWYGEDIIRIGGYEIQSEFYDIPSWSLSALLELIPPYLFEFERGIDLNIYRNLNSKGWHCSYMPNCIENMKKDKFKQITNGDNLVDAAFEMICWLLENEKL